MTESEIVLEWRETEEPLHIEPPAVERQFWTPTVFRCEVHGEQSDYLRVNESTFCVTCIEGMLKTVMPVMTEVLEKPSPGVLVDLTCEGDITASDPGAIRAMEVTKDGDEGGPKSSGRCGEGECGCRDPEG